MNDHEIEIAAQIAVDVINTYVVLSPKALDELKGRILRKLRERFELSSGDIGWETWNHEPTKSRRTR